MRKDRGTNGGGTAFLVHKDVPFQEVTSPATLKDDAHIETLTIKITSNSSPVYIRNVYISPASSCSQGYVAPIKHLADGLSDDYLILGDLNAHNELWHTQDTPDSRGTLISDWIAERNEIGILNEDVPTRITANTCTAPDVSIATAGILPSCSWSTDTTLSSDHLPIRINISTAIKQIKSDKKTYINFRKADWTNFERETEEAFSTAPHTDDVHASERFFRKVLQRAAKRNIPTGRIPKIINAVSSATAKLIDVRDKLRAEDPTSARLPEIQKEINISIRDHRQQKWLEHLDKCQPGSKQMWDTVKSLSNPPRKPENQSVAFQNKHYLDARKIANKLNSQYTPPSANKPTKALRRLLRQTRKTTSDRPIHISTDQVRKAIKKSKNSKAVGPHELSPIMLKHIGDHGISYLANIYNSVLKSSTIPSLWKVGKIIPLLKPNKPADQGTSFRPISLLSPPAKTLESIILSEIQQSITLAPHQHGFRSGRSTQTALQEITDYVTDGLNRPKPRHRTVLVAIDLSKAFDTVNHDILFDDIANLPLNNYIKRFLLSYLRGRLTYVVFRGRKSRYRKMRQGVPQGGVLSPTLFNLYMSKLPSPPPGMKLVTYADDSTVLKSGPVIGPLCTELNNYLDTLNQWFKDRSLLISPSKSSATLFTTWGNEMSKTLEIEIDGTTVPTVQNPSILGVTLDPMMTFGPHTQNLKKKINGRNNILKALAGTSWGLEKETLLTTYKATSGSLLNYCAPIFTPHVSDSNWDSLQTAQNAALRIATGCVKMTDRDHLHAECKSMPVKAHCEMLSKQFLLATTQPHHPNHSDLDDLPDPRHTKRNTLKTKFADNIKPLTAGGKTDPVSYKAGLRQLHTDAVRQTINNQAPNKVLNMPAPKINRTEKLLPRKTRTTLAQLRSGYSTYLNSYLHRINPASHPSPSCPQCDVEAHSTNHLFDCTAAPTELPTGSLWEDPPAVAAFLGLPTHEDAVLDDND